MPRFCCWRAIPIDASSCIVEAGNAREAAIKAAPVIIKDINEGNEDSILITIVDNKNKVENLRVSIQRKFTLDE
ncbi:MAG: hypothetical protein IMF19_13060, partial [Proteobacteria bacterium]|nr:hypothetical protein [Pseudomonadota bacterium]